ncbi:MAG: acyl-phosphate glycerol 3-phosphate acyltransferase [Omnitrophica WOR_2 bacterium RIFCSPHIGHO2_01_FULL_48_9]|nr:MAG: acyl-phosphate glycerol 3-phosphate acyltransferase [Omnitrophica WOR_2 bacterium RIFCSPHIGHO2_02_FULL_48_11]OGX32050.1 MAG: acyl-phosphate glycerol 3-phosphate acyltransferase [Omnitrophica WOR_2 bacterium RIFCSPHIGHO2_01_FULL_48_9]
MSNQFIIAVVFSYFLGAIPTAYIFGRLLKGIDIRQHGSGNVGATNALRVLGKGPGAAVLLLDIFKGTLATTLVPDVLGLNQIWQYVVLALTAVGGHNWTVFLNFKGGKGIATSLGVLIGLAIQIASIRIVLLATVGSWAVVFLLSGYVSLASIVAAVVLPLVMVFTLQPLALTILGVIICLSVVLRHRNNIKRLLKGEESRVFFPFQKRP